MAVESQAGDVLLHLKSGAVVSGDRLLVATGRRPNFEAGEPSGLEQTERGWLKGDPQTLGEGPAAYRAGASTSARRPATIERAPHGQVSPLRQGGWDI